MSLSILHWCTGKRVVDFLLVLIELVYEVLRLRRYERKKQIENRRSDRRWVTIHQIFA